MTLYLKSDPNNLSVAFIYFIDDFINDRSLFLISSKRESPYTSNVVFYCRS